MQTKTSLKGIKERIMLHRLLGVSCTSLAVFLLGFVMVPYLIVEANAAVDVNFDVTWTPISLTLDPDVAATEAGGSISDLGHGDVLFGTVIPSSVATGATSAANGNVGTLKILKKTIGVETTGKYYTVYLSTNTSSNDMTMVGDAALSIPAVNSSFNTPNVFSISSWGVAVPGIESTGIVTTPIFADSTIYNSRLSEELTFANAENVYKNVTWAAVPIASAPQQIWKATTNNNQGFGGEHGDDVNDHFAVYYGLMINDEVLAGTYETSVVYTALASSTALDEVSNNLSASQNFGTSGETITLAFDLAESADTSLITQNSIEAYLVKHADMVAAGFEPENLGEGEAIACVVTDFTIDASKAAIDCTLPTIAEIADDSSAILALEADEGTLTTEERAALTAVAEAGRYDFWVKVNPYNYNYVSKISDGTTLGTREAFAYVGLQSTYKVVADGANVTHTYVTEMQQVTASICSNTNMWGSYTDNNAKIYDHNGEVYVDGAATAMPLRNTSAESDALGVGTFSLVDNRDEKPYLVRRLADGDCWMVQNLDLDLEDFAGSERLNNKNTDLNTKEVWDPGETMYDIAKAIDPSVTTQQTSYFPVASEDRLGVVENYQFMPKGTVGYQQASWFSNVNGVKTRGETAENTPYAVMPRSYDNGLDYVDNATVGTDISYNVEHATKYIGNYYNWYAATAGAGTWSSYNVHINDSLCPYGWGLPVDGRGIKALGGLMVAYRLPKVVDGQYTFGNSNRQGVNASRTLPISLGFFGHYDSASETGTTAQGSNSYWWTRRAAYSNKTAYTTGIDDVTNMRDQYAYSRLSLLVIRCVIK